MSFFYKENEHLEKKVNLYFERLEDFNKEHFNGDLSVILLGSLSRGEGTWMDQDGKTVMVSDIEFFTVYPDGFKNFEKFETLAQTLAQEIFQENSSTLFHVDNTFISQDELGGLEKKLLTYDAIHFGKCVCGEDCMGKFPHVDIDNINLFDIKDILTHRAFSVLYYGLPLKKEGNIEQYKYSLAKNSLDLMTVLLVNRGILESGFINRFNRLRELDFSDEIKNYFEYCLAIKLGGDSDKEFALQEMERLFVELLRTAEKGFKFKAGNIKSNLKRIAKRQLGIAKRCIKYRHFVFGNHLERFISSIENQEEITNREKFDNLVLNGYPNI